MHKWPVASACYATRLPAKLKKLPLRNLAMQFMQRVLLVLVMINLPSYGSAFTAMPMCSIQHTQLANTAATKTAHSGHCCADKNLQHHVQLDHDCQDAAKCQCGVLLYQFTQPLTAMFIPATHVRIESTPFHLITTAALPLWRPPTLS